MRVLCTGCAGYIGSVVTRHLLGRGHCVRGLDTLLFGSDSLLELFDHPRFEFVRGDLREVKVVREALEGVDAVVHLAAMVGDAMCARDPDLAREVNLEAAESLLRLCVESPQVGRFVFASTCSAYGQMNGCEYVDEDSPLLPVSLYAKLKVDFESHLLRAPLRPSLAATALRFATAYGVSPRMRFDLTVNEFVRDLALFRALSVFDERSWRPYCHVEDLARAVTLVLEGPIEVVRQKVFNVGDTRENYTKQGVVREILECLVDLPPGLVTFVPRTSDGRNYRVDFSKISSAIDFRVTRRLADGIREITALVRTGAVGDPDSVRYRNVYDRTSFGRMLPSGTIGWVDGGGESVVARS
jgi:nucleoside-diphosphate-sugar epimerase